MFTDGVSLNRGRGCVFCLECRRGNQGLLAETSFAGLGLPGRVARLIQSYHTDAGKFDWLF